MARLLVTHGHHFGVCFSLLDDTSIGRSSACTIQLLDEKVSRLHSTIKQDGERWVLHDEGSSNGTGLNGRLLVEPTSLSPGDEVAVGNNLMLYEPDLEILRDLDGAGSVVLAAPGGGTVPAAAPGRPTREGGFQVEALLQHIAEMLAGPRGVGRPAALVEAAVKGLGAERGALLVAPTGGEPMKAVATYPHRGRITISRHSLRHVLDMKTPLLSAEGMVELTVKAGRSLIEARAGASLTVPVSIGGRIRGLFYAESGDSSTFAGLSMETVQSILSLTFSHQLSGTSEALRPPLEAPPLEEPVSQSPAMQAVLEQVRRYAEEPAPVLVCGEVGSGKAFLARYLHRLSPRSTGPFVAVHCGTLPDQTAESVLFGHEQGAFSGADARRRGCLEQADGGTILLDGVATLSPPLQVKLLRTLQEGRFYRVGGTRPVRVDVRFVAGSGRDLAALVEEGSFRQDLLSVIDVLRLDVPALRRRIADVGPLVERFVDRFNLRNGVRRRGLTPEAVGLLEGHAWPGNVQQLADATERLLIRASGDYVEAEDVEVELAALAAVDEGDEDVAAKAIRGLDRQLVARAVADCRGNKGRVALMLRVPRSAVDRLVAMYGLDAFGR